MPRGVRAKASEDRSAPNGSIFGDSVAGGNSDDCVDPRIRAEREALVSSKQRELEGVVGTHDSLVRFSASESKCVADFCNKIRELFHLEKFVSLTYFDPKVHSNPFLCFDVDLIMN